ncbi:integrin beta-7-like [Myxocyprinus asiaticus]|uniref:integrin beta-7-like n=1 Tax=Myxocyprinus asiaticus TaxID=70543 RepID=UPI00222203A7|nr:integrin beta-7-like [Myxocyprinus asiaticus]
MSMFTCVGQNSSSTLVLEQEGAPEELHVSYWSNCKGNQADIEWKEKGECKGIKHEKVEFQVCLNVSKCLKELQTFRIKMQGISEEVKINVGTVCDCNCGASEESSQHCNGNGNLSCGVCSCRKGCLGQHCECVQQQDMDSTLTMLASCWPDKRSLVCSGHGSCECGKCVCHRQYSGDYCQCDDSSCERHNNKICNGKGTRKCGQCFCEENYTGAACDCSPSTDKCESKRGLCSGQGECLCNQCKCKDGFRGDHCSAFINACTKFKDCVECHVDDHFSDTDCAKRCSNIKISRLEGTHELQCTYKDTNSYEVKLGSKGEILLQYAELPLTIDKTTVIIVSSVTSIIVIGIVIIIIYRALLELYDIGEYQNFVKAQKQTEWKEVQNPLFQGATTTVLNPLHVQNDE